MKTILKALVVSASVLVGSTVSAINVGLSPSAPLSGYDLGGNQFATLIDIHGGSSLVGETIALSNLNAAILSGTVSGFYYGPGSSSSANFGGGVTPFTPFVSNVVQPGSGMPTTLLNSLFAVHSAPVTFSSGAGNASTTGTGNANSNGGTNSNGNGLGGTSTMTTDGVRVVGNPLIQQEVTVPNAVPDNGAAVALFGAALAGLALLRRRFAA